MTRSPSQRPGGERRATTIAIQLIAIALLLGLVVWVNLYAADHDLMREVAVEFGYPGILAAAAASGFNLVVPVPIIAFFPFFIEVGFHRILTVMVIAAGMTLGDLLGYLIGHAARDVMAPRRLGLVARLERLREHRPYLPFAVMFLYAAFAPIPNELLVIPLAFLRYPLAAIFTAVLMGNIIFNGLVAMGVLGFFDLL